MPPSPPPTPELFPGLFAEEPEEPADAAGDALRWLRPIVKVGATLGLSGAVLQGLTPALLHDERPALLAVEVVGNTRRPHMGRHIALVFLERAAQQGLADLVEFHPERVYRLPDLCAALGVDPGPDDSAGVRPVRPRMTESVIPTKRQWVCSKGAA